MKVGNKQLPMPPRPSNRCTVSSLSISPPHEQTPTPFTQQLKRQLDYALSPDDKFVAVGVSDQTPGKMFTTITIMRGPQQLLVERTFPGGSLRFDSMDYRLQWSPDGRYLAVAMWLADTTYETLHIFDAQTLETVRTVGTTWMMGSLSWSPVGDTLAVLDFHRPRILHVQDSRLEDIAWLPRDRHDPPRDPEIAGLFSQERPGPASDQETPPVQHHRPRHRARTGPRRRTARRDDEFLHPSFSRGWEKLAGGSR
ncbi:MAG: WD40 repeat domain-containing protein [Janthinobacterium lividum]